MGNTNEGTGQGSKFACTSNRQDRKHNRTKARRKLTESVAMEEYDQMVAEGIQRQKAQEKEVNNNIRDNYMGRLGVNARYRGDEGEPNPNRISAVSTDTYAFGNQQNMQIFKDSSDPKEIGRTTISFNQSKSEIEQQRGGSKSPIRMQSSNVAGYFGAQPSFASGGGGPNRYSMPVNTSMTPQLVSKSKLLTDSDPMAYVAPPMEGENNTGSQIEEESKNPLDNAQDNMQNNEELFKHLSYLSQLNNDVSKHQQIEQAGPGEYQIKLFDSTAASPPSKDDSGSGYKTPRPNRHKNKDSFDLDQVSNEESKTGGRGGSRFTRHLQRMNTEANASPMRITNVQTQVSSNRESTEVTSPTTEGRVTGPGHNRSSSAADSLRLTGAGGGLRRLNTETSMIQDKSNLRSTSRSGQQIRNQMMSKLTYNKIWLRPQDKPKQSQTCIIFDWDDTILCTTFLAPHQHLIYEPNLKFPPTLQKRLSELDDVADELLIKAKTFGKVYIVTNPAQGWVELSANRFLPKVFQTLQNDIVIISARTKYEKLYPRNYQKWKVQAFLETRADMEDDAMTNLIALGDNIFEIEAAYILGNQYKSAFIKTVKFRQSPSTSELIKQIKLVLTQFDLICNSAKNLTVRLLKQSRGEEQAERARAQAQVADANAPQRLDSGTATSAAIMRNIRAAATASDTATQGTRRQ